MEIPPGSLLSVKMEIEFQGLKLKILPDVYEPQEDSFLLAQRIKADKDEKVLDVGCGSGILSLTAAKQGADVIGVDINLQAVKCAKENARLNKLKNVQFIQSNLFEKVNGKFDWILFNPPYLPVENEDIIWSGGKTGRKTIERFAENAEKYLGVNGKILMVISNLTGIKETKELFRKKGFNVKILDEEKIPFETLYLLDISRRNE